jgi:hypothetical protein
MHHCIHEGMNVAFEASGASTIQMQGFKVRKFEGKISPALGWEERNSNFELRLTICHQ